MVNRPAHPPTPVPDAAAPGWPERFLADPWGGLTELADQARTAAPGWGLRLLTVAVPVAAGVLAAQWGGGAGVTSGWPPGPG